jgi:hypothetical protein
MEVVPFTLTLPVGTNRVAAWILDERGQRRSALPIAGNTSQATIAVTAAAASIWYEFQVAPLLAGFDLWRATNFTAAELADPGISGESAAPAGDAVPNLLKYYAGLAPKTPAPALRLPQGRLALWNGALRLAMSYEHDKLVTDVLCAPEVSEDLLNWFSGPTYTADGPHEDLGTAERLTAFDLIPAGSALHRFMRLRFWRSGPR